MDTIHLISHTHWDREWYLTFQQFRMKLVHLIDRLLDIFENDAGYASFLLDGQAIILEDYLQIRPEREADVRHHISTGRLFIGPWYISPDEFLVSPEAHIRNLLEGDRICRKFGSKMLIGYLPDTFGHISQMPQILQGFGVSHACVFRGLDDQPVELEWNAPDGSSVLLSFLRESYSNAASLSIDEHERFNHEINDLGQAIAPYTLTGEILLMHGTDHMEPTQNLPAAIVEYSKSSPKYHLLHSNLPDYFEAVGLRISAKSIKLPILVGELRSSKRSPVLPNVLSTRMWIKQRNHACEINLIKWAEPFLAWNHFVNRSLQENHKNPVDGSATLLEQVAHIRSAWKLLMQCHPHDSICGTSIDQVVKEMQVRFDQVDQITYELIEQNLQMLSDQIDTEFVDQQMGAIPISDILSSIIVFNVNDQPQSDLIDLNIKLDNRFSAVEILDDQGKLIPHHQLGLGMSELISMTMDKMGMRQALGMIHDGHVAGLVIRDFHIEVEGNQVSIRAALSDHGQVALNKWKQGIAKLDEIFENPSLNEFIVHAYSDPESDLSFMAQAVPGHSYRRYWVRGIRRVESGRKESKKINPLFVKLLPLVKVFTRIPLLSRLTKTTNLKGSQRDRVIENEYFQVEANPSDGTLLIVDKLTQQVYTGLNRFIDGADGGDLYNYAPPLGDRLITSHLVSARRLIDGVSQRLIVQSGMKIPRSLSEDRSSRSGECLPHVITSTITLLPGVPRIDIHTELDNQAQDHRLRVHFPAPFSCSNALFDGHFDLLERPIDLPNYDGSWVEPPRPELPQRQFALVRNNQVSLAIANRGLPEVEVLHNKGGHAEIAITLLRGIGWLSRDDLSTRKGHAGPMGIATPDAQGVGHHAFDYSIIPGNQNIQASIHQAYAFNIPMKAINTTIHAGNLEPDQALIHNPNPNFILTAIKLSEDGTRLIVRGYNLLDLPIEVELTPYWAFKQANIINMLEEQLQDLQISQNGAIHLSVGCKKIISVCFQD